MYHIYHTEGIILASVPTGESDRFFHILTPDLGLIPVVARGSRALASKLRYHLVEYGHVGLDLVRGKDVWTLTGVLPMEDTCPDVRTYRVMADASAFLRRLIHGSVALPDMYTDVRTLRTLASKVSEKNIDALLLVFRVRTLATLGYGASDELLTPLIVSPLNEEVVQMTAAHAPFIREAIRIALADSHL
ncbi:MAG: hypothetical protein HGB03_00035 [Candidatus Yonathbacteria bacterium]|nr:hypothetical protein [Candidatus Yonathbacteria bacterium]NTW48069.1 hypothetical protein [Candidatus Yonathbacteria bacterium]